MATIFVTYVKLQLFSEKVLLYSLPSSQRQTQKVKKDYMLFI